MCALATPARSAADRQTRQRSVRRHLPPSILMGILRRRSFRSKRGRRMPPTPQTLTSQQSFSPPTDRPNVPRSIQAARDVLLDLFGPTPSRRFAVRFWDGTADEPVEAPRFTLVLRTPEALRRMLTPPSELALAEAYIFGDIDIEGDLESAIDLSALAISRLGSLGAVLRLARHVLALPRHERDTGTNPRNAGGLRRFGKRHVEARD